jgi:hypothetical protein
LRNYFVAYIIMQNIFYFNFYDKNSGIKDEGTGDWVLLPEQKTIIKY